MPSRSRSRFIVADIALVSVVAVTTVLLGLLGSGRPAASDTINLTIRRSPLGVAVPAGFLGLSLEYPAVESYAGDNPSSLDPVLLRLISNLAPRQAPVLRIGGDSADSTWWPVSGMTRPGGVTFTLNPQWLRVTRALTRALGARLILGVNLEANSPELAGAEARALIGGIGASSVEALELGNEPELYGEFAWYRVDGRGVPGRTSDYDFQAFAHQFAALAAALSPAPLAGPTISGPRWMGNLAEFLGEQPRLRLVTLHRYPLQVCFTKPSSPRYPTIAHLLSPAASTGLADTFAPYVALARARGLPLRIDELNTVSCGADAAVSDTFASALWALDVLFEMVRVGVAGVNIHTFPDAGYQLFDLGRSGGRWQGFVAPEYYGLLMFAQAAPPGSRLLSVDGATDAEVRPWAVIAPNGAVHVVLINKSRSWRAVSIRISGTRGVARFERLEAPSLLSRSGVTLGGQGLGSETSTGILAGRHQGITVRALGGRYVVRVPAASATLLVIR